MSKAYESDEFSIYVTYFKLLKSVIFYNIYAMKAYKRKKPNTDFLSKLQERVWSYSFNCPNL